MKSTKYSILTNIVSLSSVILFTCLIIFTMLTRQLHYILLGIAVLTVPMFFVKKDSVVFKVASTLALVSAVILFSTYLGGALRSMELFHIGVLLTLFVIPVLFTNSKLMTYCYVAVLLFFSGTSYGMLDRREFLEIYMKGNGQLHFSLINIYLFIILLSILVNEKLGKREQSETTIQCNLYKLFWLFNAIYISYILMGMGYGISFWDTVTYTGVIQITNMTILVFVLIQFFKSKIGIEKFMKFVLVSMAARGLFGIVRFLFFKGDPANPYLYYQRQKSVIITFFDWNDGLIACIAVIYSLWILMKTDNLLSRNWQKLYWLVVAVGLFNMTFSYRRTVWGGMILALLWFSQYLKVKQRIRLGVITVLIVSIISSYLLVNRYGEVEGGLLKSIMPDIYSEGTEGVSFGEGSRFYELSLVWETVKKNLLFGVGPWGHYEAKTASGHAQSDTTHSSLMFMLLKMGIVGLVSYLAILIAYVNFWLKARKREWNDIALRGFGEAAFAGFIFCIPSFILAPMINEYRTMSLLGLCLALPYVAYYFDGKKPAANIREAEI